MDVSCEWCVMSVQISALGLSLVQRSPTDRGVSELHRASLDNKEDLSGFGGLVVSMLASGTETGFETGRSR